MVQDRAIVTTADQYKVVYDLSSAPFSMTLNDLDRVTCKIISSLASSAGAAINQVRYLSRYYK